MISIAVTISDGFSENLAALLRSIIKFNRSQITIYVITDFISDENQNKLNTTVRKSTVCLNFIINDNLGNHQFKTDKHAKQVNYYRIFLPELLPAHLNKVLYLDSDLLVLKDLKSLWNTNISDYSMAAVNHINEERIQNLKLKSHSYINTGVLLINLSYWRKHDITYKLKDFITKNADLLKFWDQDAINSVLEESILLLNIGWNYCGEYSKEMDIGIIHFVGIHKPNNKHYKKNKNKKLYYKHLLRTPYWKTKYYQYLL